MGCQLDPVQRWSDEKTPYHFIEVMTCPDDRDYAVGPSRETPGAFVSTGTFPFLLARSSSTA